MKINFIIQTLLKKPNKNEKNEINKKETIKNNLKKEKLNELNIFDANPGKKKIKYDNGDMDIINMD